jgi:hypothetical protein
MRITREEIALDTITLSPNKIKGTEIDTIIIDDILNEEQEELPYEEAKKKKAKAKCIFNRGIRDSYGYINRKHERTALSKVSRSKPYNKSRDKKTGESIGRGYEFIMKFIAV